MVDVPIKTAVFMEFHGYFKADSAIHDGENPLPFSTKRRKQGKETSNPDNLRVECDCTVHSQLLHLPLNHQFHAVFVSVCVCSSASVQSTLK